MDDHLFAYSRLCTCVCILGLSLQCIDGLLRASARRLLPRLQLKNYYSPIWIAMRWYKARAFMRHHKTSEPRQRRLPIKHKGLIPFSSKLVIQQGGAGGEPYSLAGSRDGTQRVPRPKRENNPA